MQLQFLWLDPGRIDPSDETFRVRRRHPASLRQSIERSGIQSPLIIEPLSASTLERYRIVAGWGRWLSRPHNAQVPCFALPCGVSAEAAWDAFLRDNDRWNVIEIARVLDRLGRLDTLDAERIVSEKLPLLGLHASNDIHRRHLRLLELSPAAQSFVEDEDLPLRKASALFKLPAAAIEGLLRAASELGLTFNEIGEAIELIEETANRDRVEASNVIDEARASGPTKDMFRQLLRERRYPELTRYREQITSIEKQLRFTTPVRIEWDARLERPGIRLIADLADADALTAFERDVAANRDLLHRLL